MCSPIALGLVGRPFEGHVEGSVREEKWAHHGRACGGNPPAADPGGPSHGGRRAAGRDHSDTVHAPRCSLQSHGSLVNTFASSLPGHHFSGVRLVAWAQPTQLLLLRQEHLLRMPAQRRWVMDAGRPPGIPTLPLKQLFWEKWDPDGRGGAAGVSEKGR